MTRSKSKKGKASLTTATAASAGTDSTTSSAPSSPSLSTAGPPPLHLSNSNSALIICRNKHWRYISSFHGPWLQLPPEVLESLALNNLQAPRPRPIDPAVFFDLVKIRKYVDEATNLAVRAASGVASSHVKDPSLLSTPAGILGLSPNGGAGPRLSRERKHRMRELATQKLSAAYQLDEIAASVATMQSASSLEDVASIVLTRNPKDPDATYVHFFHEKIPSRMLAKSTSLEPLDHVITERSTSAGPALRTRAVTRVFKDDHTGAASDLTSALNLVKLHSSNHDLPTPQHPSSLEPQLLFHRASAHLSLACAIASSALTPIPDQGAFKSLRALAKRAIRDYTRFLGFFDYAPRSGSPATNAAPACPRADVKPISTLFSTASPPDVEALTYHPLLTDALHSFLLAHCLVCTPIKELLRHAYTISKLCKVADGYPIFLGARSPARADWMEVLRKCNGRIPLGDSWETLCAPLPPSDEGGGVRWGGEEVGKEYPVSTERAGIVSKWVREGWSLRDREAAPTSSPSTAAVPASNPPLPPSVTETPPAAA